MNRKKPMRAITMIELGCAGILLIVLALLVYWYSDGLSSYSPKALTYQCIGNAEKEYSEDTKFSDESSHVTYNNNEGKGDIADAPILHRDSKDITLSKNMLLMVPSDGRGLKRINRFTTVSQNGKLITFTSGKKSAQTLGGFLYDGNDTYIFLEDTTLKIGNNIVELPAMSYAKVDYAKKVEYYNSETKKNDVIAIVDVEVYSKSRSGFELELCKDVIIDDKEESLLFSAVDAIDVIEME